MSIENGKSISLKELAALCGGRVVGDENVKVSSIASLDVAKEGELTFLTGHKNFDENAKHLKDEKIAAVITSEDLPELPIPSIRLKNPHLGLIAALNFFRKEIKISYHIHPTAYVSETAKVASDAIIGPNAVVEDGAVIGEKAHIEGCAYVGRNASVGANSHIYPGVRVLDYCVVGSNCIIHSNTVIGSDGYGFAQANGEHIKVPQLGNVVIEDNVEIGACVTIDRSTMESTVIGEGTKTDNQIHIAHNVQIGKKCLLVAQVGISGGAKLGNYVVMAGKTGCIGHVKIGDGSTILACGIVTNNVPDKSYVSGYPAKPHQEELRIKGSLRKLPDLIKRVRDLENKLNEQK
ncbi:MAG: UDP-3-O-(3-hydroxymyristoyl)glucosamine N-acyltransferase [Candidatus Riflebacteria bacterium]|nr:UDP-3-O-(3-hydroxymyristoyl)glucosamine N-acyltransferase [Candidatus Riflebacteria bacterium]